MAQILTKQECWERPLLQGVTANGTGPAVPAKGYKTLLVDVVATIAAASSVTLQIQGSWDGVNWYNVGYVEYGGLAVVGTRAVAALTYSTTGTALHAYQLQDLFAQYRVVVSAVSGTVSASATLHEIPV